LLSLEVVLVAGTVLVAEGLVVIGLLQGFQFQQQHTQ
jgi:hypothetical protein